MTFDKMHGVDLNLWLHQLGKYGKQHSMVMICLPFYLKLQFSSKFQHLDCSLYVYRAEIEKHLQKLALPHFVTRIPTKLSKFKS